MVAVQLVVAAVCVVLMAAASLRAVPGLWKRVTARDLLLVVPDSGYFAPTPNTADYYLLARRETGSPWASVRTSHRRPGMFLIDPDRRRRKALVDLGAMYITIDSARRRLSLDEARVQLSTSVPYLVALNTCSSAVDASWTTLQFGFARLDHRDRPGSREPADVVDLIAVSDVHPVHG